MIKAKTCEGCKAIKSGQCENTVCTLNYAEYKPTSCGLGSVFNMPYPPKSGCPKPKTYKDLIDCEALK